jgi:choline dehydrogenase-like flavoprotein
VFTDGRAIPAGTTVECDVCIVGTGAAGVSAAIGLRDSGLRLCVIEAGGLQPDEEARSTREVESVGLPIGPRSRERFFGGTTNTWWGKVAALDEIDLRVRPWVPLSGWPIDAGQLARHYRRATALLRIPDLTVGREDFETGDLATAAFFWWRRPPNFGELYRRSVADRHHVRTILHATVTHLDLDESGTRVRSLVVATAPERTFTVQPRAAVLATGGIENPRLLLASRSGEHAVGNRHDQVGRYFMDHPRGSTGTVHPTPGATRRLSSTFWHGRRFGPGRIRLGMRLSDRAQEQHETLNSYVLLNPVYPGTEGRGPEALRELYRRGARALSDPRVLRDLVAGVPSTVGYLSSRWLGIGGPTGIRVQSFMEQEPRPEHRVELTDRRDHLGVPLPRVHWTISDLSRHTLRELHRCLAAELERRGIGRLESLLLQDGEWPSFSDAAHHMGTTRMGSDPGTSVVDADGRVHGIENLYVAGSSVFPTGGYANPTLTIVALALRLADTIKGSLER